MIWFGLTWSLELYEQANARLYRQGQKETVVIHHIITKGTIDEDVMLALKRKEKYEKANILDDEFRKLMFSYLYENSDDLENEQSILRELEIIPVYAEQKGVIRYVSWEECEERLYIKPNCTVSSSNCYILATHLLEKKVCESIFGEDISELTGQIELANYREKLMENIRTMENARLYAYLLAEFSGNKQMLSGCQRAGAPFNGQHRFTGLHKDNTPWKVGLGTYYFTVHKVANAHHSRKERCCNSNIIERPHHSELCFPCIKNQCYNDANNSSMTRQSLVSAESPAVSRILYWQQHFNRVAQVVFGLIKKAMSQACTYQYSKKAVEEQWLEKFFALSGIFI